MIFDTMVGLDVAPVTPHARFFVISPGSTPSSQTFVPVAMSDFNDKATSYSWACVSNSLKRVWSGAATLSHVTCVIAGWITAREGFSRGLIHPIYKRVLRMWDNFV